MNGQGSGSEICFAYSNKPECTILQHGWHLGYSAPWHKYMYFNVRGTVVQNQQHLKCLHAASYWLTLETRIKGKQNDLSPLGNKSMHV